MPILEGARSLGWRLVPRTRSSRIPCREFDRELRVQRGTRIIELLVVLDSEGRKRGCRTNDANFGIGPLVLPNPKCFASEVAARVWEFRNRDTRPPLQGAGDETDND